MSLRRFYFLALWLPVLVLVGACIGTTLVKFFGLAGAKEFQSAALNLSFALGLPYIFVASSLTFSHRKSSVEKIISAARKFPLYNTAIFFLYYMVIWTLSSYEGVDDFPPLFILLASLFLLIPSLVYWGLVCMAKKVLVIQPNSNLGKGGNLFANEVTLSGK